MSFLTKRFLYSQFFVKPAYPKTSFSGQTVIITGSNTGLGKEAARHFARLDASKIILAVRNTQAGEAARKEIEGTTKCDTSVIEVWSLDLSSYDSVKIFADRANKLPRLDVLIENAGVAKMKYSEAEGHERTITVNVISTFLLALLLLPKLQSTARDHNTRPHLSIVSSEVHEYTKFPEWKQPKTFDALDDPSGKNMGERYPTSKLLEVLICRQLAPQIESSGVILNYLNPGFCHSELAREAPFLVVGIFKFFFARSTEVGSRTLMAAATAGPESHGKWMMDGTVEDEALSHFVRSEDGTKAGAKVWSELKDILEVVQPGVTKGL